MKNTAKRNMSSAVCALSMHSRLFCLCAHVQCRVCYVYHVEFHFRFRRLVTFPVEYQLWRGCHSEKSSKKISGNFLRGGEGGNVFEGWGNF